MTFSWLFGSFLLRKKNLEIIFPSSFCLNKKKQKFKNERQLQVLVYPPANASISLKLAVRSVRSHPRARRKSTREHFNFLLLVSIF